MRPAPHARAVEEVVLDLVEGGGEAAQPADSTGRPESSTQGQLHVAGGLGAGYEESQQPLQPPTHGNHPHRARHQYAQAAHRQHASSQQAQHGSVGGQTPHSSHRVQHTDRRQARALGQAHFMGLISGLSRAPGPRAGAGAVAAVAPQLGSPTTAGGTTGLAASGSRQLPASATARTADTGSSGEEVGPLAPQAVEDAGEVAGGIGGLEGAAAAIEGGASGGLSGAVAPGGGGEQSSSEHRSQRGSWGGSLHLLQA